MMKNSIMLVLAMLFIFGTPGLVWGAQAEIIFEEGIVFSEVSGETLKLNLARPKGADAPLPAVVLIHGGGWRAGERGPVKKRGRDDS